jgi:predicted ribosome quality control (RQC) complex YloA/Tae2 family protein
VADGGGGDARFRTFNYEGCEILVGRGARENDQLTFRVAGPNDLWLHAAGFAGSHVVVRVPESGSVPRQVVEYAAQLAAFHSKARAAGGKVAVHVCRASDVRKPRGAPAGQVQLRRFDVVRVYPRGGESAESPGEGAAG